MHQQSVYYIILSQCFSVSFMMRLGYVTYFVNPETLGAALAKAGNGESLHRPAKGCYNTVKAQVFRWFVAIDSFV
jgi:hypothetical protein